MPIYRYRTRCCKDEHELVQTMEEGDSYRELQITCPKCGAEEKPERLITNTNFKLGAGSWFKNGYN